MSEWVTQSTAALISKNLLFIGDGYRAKNSELTDVGIPFARAGNINGGFRFDNADYLPMEYANRIREKVSKPGDIVFTSKGTVGRFAYVGSNTPRFIFSPQLCCWRSLSEASINSRYLYYWMHSREFFEQVETLKGQTDMADYVSLSDQRRMAITLPPLPEQRAIASVLSSLDDKIDLLHRQNKTLEAMAETLFRQWFVEEASEIVPITNYIDFNPPRMLKKGIVAPYLDMAGVNTAAFNPSGWYDREFTSGTKFINGDTLIARITPCLENGKSAFITFLENDQVGWGSTEFIVMRSVAPLVPFFSYALARNQEFRDYAEACMSGSSGRQRVDVEHLKQFEIGKVSEKIAIRFNDAIGLVPEKLHNNMQQIRTLEKLRDTLLPKLMSGEVRVEYE